MVDNAFADVLTIAQTVGIIGTMLISLYFSRKQVQSISVDVETQVLNDLDEKIHRMGELLIERPKMLKVIAKGRPNFSEEGVYSYYVLFICSHAYHMRQRKVLSDNEWAGWLAWIKDAFTFGTARQDWISRYREMV
jgi:hypothetical protein